ncbi:MULTISPECIES: hypothetical protein [unclassified Crossiella]|uniref:hypothetical protein n=1 Tax=unclassified Crossiella TaxID=2620835 RepID=UPI001FFEBDFF|nr:MULTISPECIES: hypothetical protein [unclassified Crossiella]MCK2239886.1 hypothetical protein [Crossiella sp. S99.2]MCK2252594.1 hypothetical protein [Crossiella sp. S99.1]
MSTPLSLLAEWTGPLRELLITGHAVDLDFLERHCLPRARELGARVTVLTGHGAAQHQPADVRFAGRAYQHGHALGAGAFLPRLAVLLGEDRVWVAVGSGDPTLPGWQGGGLWLAVRGSLDDGPAALADLGTWLADLGQALTLPSWLADTLDEIAIAMVPARTREAGLRFLGNLAQPLLAQLPVGPTRALGLAAPAADPAAVRALTEHLQPREVRTAPAGATLIEWQAANGRWTALAGGHLTESGLLRSVADGGDCVLAGLHPRAEPVLPEDATTVAPEGNGDPLPPKTVVAQDTKGPRLLGAFREDDTTVVEFLVPRGTHGVIVETLTDNGWLAAHRVPAAELYVDGPVRARIPAEEPGIALRVSALVDERRVASAGVHVTDLTACASRAEQISSQGLAPWGLSDRPAAELLADPARLSRFTDTLGKLTADQLPFRPDWAAFAGFTHSVLGAPLAERVLPGAVSVLPEPRPSAWSVGELAEQGHGGGLLIPEQDRDKVRAHTRRWLAAITADSPLPVRMLITCLYLDLIAAGVWGHDDDWRTGLGELAQALCPTETEQKALPDQAQARLSTLLAACLALLLQDADLQGGSAADRTARHAWERCYEWAAFGRPELVEPLLPDFRRFEGRTTTVTEVEQVLELAENSVDEPSAAVQEDLRERGFEIDRLDGAWVVTGECRRPLREAARMITDFAAVSKQGGTAVVVSNRRTMALLLWSGRSLAFTEGKPPTWRSYQLSGLSTPHSLIGGSEGVPSTKDIRKLLPLPDSVRELAERCGVDLPSLISRDLVGR